jgi:hypothetical protein
LPGAIHRQSSLPEHVQALFFLHLLGVPLLQPHLYRFRDD